jgi:hypothetical protein
VNEGLTEATVTRFSDEPGDLDLLRRHEPVLAFTQGEMFFPMDVEAYVRSCSLTMAGDGAGRDVLVKKGSLTSERLIEAASREGGRSLALNFVDEPLGGMDYRRWASHRTKFKARGRLARVGLVGRIADAVFQLTLLLRGRVPGGTAARAQTQYSALQTTRPSFTYYGRVVRYGGYVVLNYLYFYAMNDWRSSFHGVNDHEGDWEQVMVYLAETRDGDLEPAWIAYASHDYYGCDLRRRWDDPDIRIVDGHPIVFVGAGSHASYFEAGEYVTSVRPTFMKPVSDVAGFLRRFWRDTLRQGDPKNLDREVEEFISVPYVDYARGDGPRIGAGQHSTWTAAVIDEEVPWVSDYRGLWGLDTGDVFGGERAPAGPKYNRDGTIRASWADPIGWAELDLEPGPGSVQDALLDRIARLRGEADRMAVEADAIRAQLPQLHVEVRALNGMGWLGDLQAEREAGIRRLEADLRRLTTEEAELRSAVQACERLQAETAAGHRAGPRDHLRHAHSPEPPQTFRNSRLADVWAAVSIGLLLVLVGALIFIGAPWYTALIILAVGFLVVDNILRGTLVGLFLSTVIVLAVATGAVLVYEFFWWLVLTALAVAGLSIIARNLRELRPFG